MANTQQAKSDERATEKTAPGDPAAGAVSPVHLTVIMAACDSEPFVASALESVLAQTHQSFEIVVVENGSRDRTRQIVEQFCVQDRRVRLFSFPERLGAGGGTQRALELSTTEFVVNLDHDDVMLPDCLAVQLEMLRQHPQARVIGGRGLIMSRYGRVLGVSQNELLTPGQAFERVRRLELLSIQNQGVLLHRPTILAVGGYRSKFRSSGVDNDLWARVVEHGHQVLSHGRPVVKYRVHLAQTGTRDGMARPLLAQWVVACMKARRDSLAEPTWEEFLTDWRRQPLLFRMLRNRLPLAHHLYRQAGILFTEGHRSAALVYITGALVLSPTWITSLALRQLGLSRGDLEKPD